MPRWIVGVVVGTWVAMLAVVVTLNSGVRADLRDTRTALGVRMDRIEGRSTVAVGVVGCAVVLGLDAETIPRQEPPEAAAGGTAETSVYNSRGGNSK